MSNPTRLLTVQQWTEQHPWPPLGGLRHLIFFSKSNGFDVVIRRVGRRVLIDESAFLAWVDQARRSSCLIVLSAHPPWKKSPRTC
jgi:hypothetical protein